MLRYADTETLDHIKSHPLIDADSRRTESESGKTAKAIDADTPANLLQQIRGPTLRDERINWNIVRWMTRSRHPCLL